MKTALITLSDAGAIIVNRLAESLTDADIFLHESVSEDFKAPRFQNIIKLTADIFGRYGSLVYVVPCGVAVRAVSPCIHNKYTDPAVVVVDAGGRYAVSLLSGHEGGANDLAVAVSNIIGGEPVITTTTEALKKYIVGIGCRRGTEEEAVVRAVREALRQASVDLSEVRFLASADIKSDEKGLLAAARSLGIPIRFIPSEEIRESTRTFARSAVAEREVNLPAVAEPAALLAGRRTRLILPKTKLDGITVAVARESFSWWESDREDR